MPQAHDIAGDAEMADLLALRPFLPQPHRLLNNAARLPSWTRQVLKTSGDYVGTPVAYSSPDGIRYELFYACKAHDCADNAMELMFAPNGDRAWAALMEDGKSVTYLGSPSAAQQAALKKAFQK